MPITMKKIYLVIICFICAYSISNAQISNTFVGFAAIGLSNDATPAEVCAALPVGAHWQAYIRNGKSSAWSGYHKFTGTVFAEKVSEDVCLMYRIEDNYAESGWSTYLSPSTVYHAQYRRCPNAPNGYVFTGFEPLNGKSQSNMRNDGVAAMELVRVCESYEGVYWQYDSKMHTDEDKHQKAGDLSLPNGFFTQDDLKDYEKSYREGIYKDKDFPVIDCQTLIRMAMAGIPYEYSHYADKTYQYRYLNAYPWAVQTPNVWLYELMEYCISSGYEIAPGPNFENLQAGDLIFIGSTSQKRDAQARRVDHVAMFTGRWVADKGYKPEGVSGKDYPVIYSFPIYDKNGKRIGNDTTSLHPQTIEVFQASDKLPNKCVVRHGFLDSRIKDSNRRDRIVMYARLPLNTHGCWNNRNKWDNPANMIHTSGFDTDFRIDIVGDGKPMTLYIGSLNQSGVLTSQGNLVVTGYMPYSPTAFEKLPDGAKVNKVEYYDESLNKVSDASKAKYIRKHFQNVPLSKLQSDYMYNGVNQYKVWNDPEQPIIISGTLEKGEHAIIDTKTGRVFTTEGSRLTIIWGKKSNPGMKVIYCPAGQDIMVTWNN